MSALAMLSGSPLHFVRPHWLWALLALPLLASWWRARRQRDSVWHGVVDPHLLPHLLEAGGDRRTRGMLGYGLVAWTLAVVALAGPAWRKVEQPLWQTRAPLVVALDLSSAAQANDLPPSRLLQARAQLASLLRERSGGQVGLVAYAGDAFTVAPLTDDAGNVALFLDALAPDVMPVDGQRADRAIRDAMRLLEQAGFKHGDILLLTDSADAAARAYATSAARAGYRVSTLGIGTAAGAPYRDREGRIGQARLDAAALRALAAAGNGRYVALTPDVTDLRALGVLDPQQAGSDTTHGKAGATWQDEGYWLLPPLMLLALFAFRRGGGVAALALCLALPVRAADVQGTPWRRPDQVAHARMEQGAAAYREGDFARAAGAYGAATGADADYNRGNALARQGLYEAAIQAYDEALRARPGMADALANKRAVEAAMKRKPPPGPQGNRGKQDQKPPSQGGQQGQQAGATPPEQAGQPPGERPARDAPSPARQGQAPGQSPPARQPAPPPAKPVDGKAQRAADAAQRERMQRALADAQRAQATPPANRQAQARTETPAQRERRLANDAWLQRIPDDPGGLLRAKFRIEYERRLREGEN
jgi:Ca-activated chloride channel family protein